MMPSMKTILSIDGGGIRGIIPALVVAELEKLTGKPASLLFDYIAGTSTGGIIAVGLACPGANGKPKYSAADLADLYVKEGSEIFHHTFWHRVEALGNLAGPLYDGGGAEKVFHNYFGGWDLKSALTRVLVTAYEIESRMPAIFKSWEAQQQEGKNYLFSEVARATSAAPTFFPPAKVRGKAFIDGGVFANNPTMCVLAEVKKLHPDDEVLVVSLGTGNADRPISYESAKSWGLAGWAEPLLDILIDGVSDTVDYQASLMVGSGSKPGSYFRFQTDIPREIQKMDDVHPQTIELLKAWAARLVTARSSDLATVAGLLTSRA
jgi:uncharacterized protein